jgi:hypothetical protein
MTLEEYFALPDSPSKHSPVGELMARIIKQNPSVPFEQARAEANRLRLGRKTTRLLSPEQREKERNRLGALRRTSNAAISRCR